MSADIKEKLLEAGKESGSITIDLLNDLIPEDKDPDAIDDIFDFLTESNIEVLSHEKPSGDNKHTDRKTPNAAATSAKNSIAPKEESAEVEETTTTRVVLPT